MAGADPSFNLTYRLILSDADASALTPMVEAAVTRGLSNAAAKVNDVSLDARTSGVRTNRAQRQIDTLVDVLTRFTQTVAPTLAADRSNVLSGGRVLTGVTDSPANVRESLLNEGARTGRRAIKRIEREDAREYARSERLYNRAKLQFRTEATQQALSLERLSANQNAAYDVQQRAARRAAKLRGEIARVDAQEFDVNRPGQITGLNRRVNNVRNFTSNTQYTRDQREVLANTEEMAQVTQRLAANLSSAQRSQQILRTTGGSEFDIAALDRYIREVREQMTAIRRTRYYDPAFLQAPVAPGLNSPDQAVAAVQARRTEDRSRQENSKAQKEIARAAGVINSARDQEIRQLQTMLRLSQELDQQETRRADAAARLGRAYTPAASYTSRIQSEIARVSAISGTDIASQRGQDQARYIRSLLREGAEQAIRDRQLREGRALNPDERNTERRSFFRRVRDTQGGAAAFFGIDSRLDTGIDRANPGVTSQTLRDSQRAASAEATRFEREARQAEATLRRQERQIENNSTSWRKFGDQIGLAGKRFGAFLVGSTPIFAVLSGISEGFREALAIERSQTRLSQILGTGRGEVSSIVQTAISGASQFGVRASSTLSGVDVLAQAGVNDPAELQNLTRLLGRVPLAATFGSLQETSEGLIAIREIFGNSGDSLLPRGLGDTEKLFDRLSRVSADYAVEVRDIFEAVRRGGSTFRETGGDLSEFIKLVTLVRSRSRESAESIGVFFKSLSFRLQRSSSIKLLSALNIDTENGPYQTLRQLSDTFSSGVLRPDGGRTELTEGQRVRIAESIAGVNQGGKFITLLQSLAEDRGRFERTISSSGGAFTTETDKRVADVATSLERIRETFSKILFSVIDSTAIREFFNGLASVSNLIGKFGSVIAGAIVPLIAFGAALGRNGAAGVLYGLAGRTGIIGDRDGVERLSNAFAPVNIDPRTGRDANRALREQLQQNLYPEGVRRTFYRNAGRNSPLFQAGILNSVQPGENPADVLLAEQGMQRRELARQRLEARRPLARLSRQIGRFVPSGNRTVIGGILAAQAVSYGAGQRGAEVQADIDENGLNESNASIRRNAKVVGGLADAATYAITAGFINPLLGVGVGLAGIIKAAYEFEKNLRNDTNELRANSRISRLLNLGGNTQEFRNELETLSSENLDVRLKVLQAANTQDVRSNNTLNVGKVLRNADLNASTFSSDAFLERYLPFAAAIGVGGSAGLGYGLAKLLSPLNADNGLASSSNTLLGQQELDKFVKLQSEAIEFQKKSAGTKGVAARKALLEKLNSPENETILAYQDYRTAVVDFFASVNKALDKGKEAFTDIETEISSGRIKVPTKREAAAAFVGGNVAARLTGELRSVDAATNTIRQNYNSSVGALLAQYLQQNEVLSTNGILKDATGKDADTLRQVEAVRTALLSISAITGTSVDNLTKTLLSGGAQATADAATQAITTLLDRVADATKNYATVFNSVEDSISKAYDSALSRRQEVNNLGDRAFDLQTTVGLRNLRNSNATPLETAQFLTNSRRGESFSTSALQGAAGDVSIFRRAISQFGVDTSIETQKQVQRQLTESQQSYNEQLSEGNRALALLSDSASKTADALATYQSELGVNRQTLSGLDQFDKKDVRRLNRLGVGKNLEGIAREINIAANRSGLSVQQILDQNPGVFGRNLKGREREAILEVLQALPGDANIGKAFKTGNISGDQISQALNQGADVARQLFGDDFTASILKRQESLYTLISKAQDDEKTLLERQVEIIESMRAAQEKLLGADLVDVDTAIGRRGQIDAALRETMANIQNALPPLLAATNKLADRINTTLGSIELRVDPILVEVTYKDAVGIQSLLKLESDKIRMDLERVLRENLLSDVNLTDQKATTSGSPTPDIPVVSGGTL